METNDDNRTVMKLDIGENDDSEYIPDKLSDTTADTYVVTDGIIGGISDSVKDRILGAIFGHALGDAIGLCTNFKNKKDITSNDFNPFTSENSKSDWSFNTDHMICTMLSIDNIQNIPNSLQTWLKSGFPELGDTTPQIPGVLSTIISNPKFLDTPVEVAHELWNQSGKMYAGNSCIGRISAIGCVPSSEPQHANRTQQITNLAAELCQLTHIDPRCVLACIIHSQLVHKLIYENSSDSVLNCDAMLQECISTARAGLSNIPDSSRYDDELSKWCEPAYTCTIEDLKLSLNTQMDYVLKSLGCSIYALQVIKVSLEIGRKISFKKLITRIAAEGKSASTNCAASGAIIGAYLGYKALRCSFAKQKTGDWLAKLEHHDWLMAQCDTFCNKLFSK